MRSAPRPRGPGLLRGGGEACAAGNAGNGRPAATGRARASGFSLLEVLVAFVILSLVATALFRLFSGALGNAGAAEEYSRAILVAQSALDQAAIPPLREGTSSGTTDDGHVQWTVQVTPYEVPGLNPDLERASAALPSRMFRLVSTVRFPGPTGTDRTLALSTLRIGAREVLQ